MMRRRLASFGVAFLLTSGVASTAFGFCQTTTCDPELSCDTAPEDCCILDANNCDTNGLIVTWPSMCVSYSIQADASPLRGVDFATFDAVVTRSLERWTNIDCGGARPSISIENLGASSCTEPDIQPEGQNANVWMFRDDVWPYEDADVEGSFVDAAALALTTISFNTETAELYDADVEFNSARANFTTGDTGVRIDLETIATHEAGHFFGLDHSNDSFATMTPGYTPGTLEGRTLSEDDEAGLCMSYPLDRQVSSVSCDPRGGYQDCEGCSIGPGAGYSFGGSVKTWLIALAALGALALRRRRAQPTGA